MSMGHLLQAGPSVIAVQRPHSSGRGSERLGGLLEVTQQGSKDSASFIAAEKTLGPLLLFELPSMLRIKEQQNGLISLCSQQQQNAK